MTSPAILPPLRRWLILGHCGAGKSTLAGQMGQALGLPVVHLDKLNWRPGWTVAPAEEFRQQLHEAVAGERWIIEGNYANSLPLRLPRAQAVVWLDYPLPLCLWRIGRRVWRYRGQVRPDMGEGCPERLDWEFVAWTVNEHTAIRRRILRALRRGGRHVTLFQFTSPSEAQIFLQDLRHGRSVAGSVVPG